MWLIYSIKKKLAGKAQLVLVNSNNTVAEVLHILAINSIQSAPVMEQENNVVKCIGFVDVLDIVGLAFQIMKQANLTLHEFFSNPFFDKKIKEALWSATALNEWVPVEEKTSLLNVLHAFTSNYIFRPHRLPVVDKEGDIIGIISQTDILRIAATKTDLIDNFLSKTIEELKLEHAVIAARCTIPASDALGLLTDNRVHGVAIVQPPSSKLLANLSASDLVGMTKNDLALFDKPVTEFLQAIYARRGYVGLKPPVSCHPHAPFSQVLSLLIENEIHRIYVTDQEQHAIGIISVGDVIEALKNC